MLLLLPFIFIPMLLEARLSRRHERWLRERGAIEPPADVYGAMQFAYPASFLAILGEGWYRGAGPVHWLAAGAAVFVAAKALKYWAIATLGQRWSFRVLVLPGAALITSGPYRWLRHPNYVGVAGELLGIALAARAPVAGVLSLAAFGALLLARIRVEDRALRAGIRQRASHGARSGLAAAPAVPGGERDAD